MPIENERKFVLDEQGNLEAALANTAGVTRRVLRQGYLDTSGLRIRAIEAPDATRHVLTYKRTVDGQMVEIETDISQIDFDRLWTLRRESLRKVRYAWEDGRYHWDVDFFKTEDGRTYFAMAEVEMPEEQVEPPPPAAAFASHVLLLAPRDDPRFTSKRLADRAHAERLLANIRGKGQSA
jgi:CYTH domain-containing protein